MLIDLEHRGSRTAPGVEGIASEQLAPSAGGVGADPAVQRMLLKYNPAVGGEWPGHFQSRRPV